MPAISAWIKRLEKLRLQDVWVNNAMMHCCRRWWRQKRVRELFAWIPELSENKIVEALGVEQDNPLLVAMMHVLKSYEEMAVDSTQPGSFGPAGPGSS